MSTAIKATDAPQFPLPFSHAVRAGDTVYVSGQVGVDPATLQVVGETIEEQTAQSIRNIETILQAAGLTLDHVVKVNAYLAHGDLVARYNEAYRQMFRAPYPARTTISCGGIGSYLVEIDAVAYAPSPRDE